MNLVISPCISASSDDVFIDSLEAARAMNLVGRGQRVRKGRRYPTCGDGASSGPKAACKPPSSSAFSIIVAADPPRTARFRIHRPVGVGNVRDVIFADA